MIRAAVAVAVATGAVFAGAGAAVAVPEQPQPRVSTYDTEMTTSQIRDVQIRLNDVGIRGPITGRYTSRTGRDLRRFQWKFDLPQTGEGDARTLRKLTRLTKSGDGVPRVCTTRPRAVCVDKRQKILRYYRRGVLKRAVDARFGRKGARTREGNWKITRKRKDDYSTLYRSPMPWSSYFSGGQAVHYSKYFAAAGYNGASHGCINIGSKKDAKWLWRRMPVGSFLKVYR